MGDRLSVCSVSRHIEIFSSPSDNLLGLWPWMQPRRAGRLLSLGMLHVSLSTSLLLAGLGRANSVCVRVSYVEIDWVRGHGLPTVRAAWGRGRGGAQGGGSGVSISHISRRFHASCREARIPALLLGLQTVSVGGRRRAGDMDRLGGRHLMTVFVCCSSTPNAATSAIRSHHRCISAFA